jgi:UDPglucose 6-dehydrogenase
MAEKIIRTCGGSVEGRTLAVLGFSFKPNTDDMRESPSIEIVQALQRAGAAIRGFDPAITDDGRANFENIVWCEGAYDCMNGADALVILTEWNEFRALDFERAKELLKSPVLVDLRNIYEPTDIAAAGFHYASVGRPSVRPSEPVSAARSATSGEN